ncbi:MAG TPA: ABC transporter ATP-binding protein [Thermoanaerobaculia bacterium]|nr:ABC transporter ATP-binding protein [Thermoanaerobaculia bacterium]
MSHEHAIAANGVTVRYGRKVAVDDLTLRVPTGSVYALLGRNGAGKSSLVRCLLGQRKSEAGNVTLLGMDVWSERQRLMDLVGVVPEDSDAPPQMTVRELAAFCARVYSRWQGVTFDECLDRFSISTTARFGELSKGHKKGVMLAVALAMSPEILVLDDPTLGLDVVARRSLFDEVIGEMAERGITTLITTHDLGGIEALADRVAIMKDGRIVLEEETEALKNRFRRIRFAAAPVALSNLATAAVRSWGSGTEAIVSNYDERTSERFPHAEISPLSLEEIFIAVSGEGEKS